MHDEADTGRNPFAAHQTLLRERLYALLMELAPALRVDTLRALQEKGKLLSQADLTSSTPLMPAGTWALLPTLIAQSLLPDVDTTRMRNVAIAMECLVCALDVLDDVEDEDQTPVVRELGIPRALNVSTTLLMLALRALLSSPHERDASLLTLRLLDAFQQATLTAASGQHQDLLAEQRRAEHLSQEECIQIATEKAGALMRLACVSGAICAEASDELCERFAQMGELLGVAHQLDNDAHDLYYLLYQHPDVLTHTITKSDLSRSKKTLPVALAAKRGVSLQDVNYNDDKMSEEELRVLREEITSTWGFSLLYRERARDCLQTIESEVPVSALLRLLLGF